MLLRFFLLLCALPLPALAAPDFHVVFDLDWTLVYPLEAAPNPPDPLAVQAAGKWYRYSDGAAESIQRLLERGVKVSFFSGGDTTRNLELLRQLRLPNGTTAAQAAHKILNAEDLTRVSEDNTLKFPQRFKKDLRKITPDLDRVVLIDDIKEFSLPGQERNMRWTGPTYNFSANYDESAARINREWEAPSLEAWKQERSKITRAVAEIEAKLERLKYPSAKQGCGAQFLSLSASFAP